MLSIDPQPTVPSLEAWVRADSSVLIHPSLRFAHDERHGVHWRATDPIASGTDLLSIPHSYCLSYLNALVDDAYPVFKSRRQEFSIEAIGFFYLMLQYINRKQSFWRPYLDVLPSPESDQLCTPLWFDEDQDNAWLRETDVAETMAKRKLVYEQYYASGCEVLARAGVDVSQFSWDLFRWSITIFTSRSFPSVSIAPQGSKYWAAFKNAPHGARQTVLLDMSHIAAEDLDFSVLFPVIDTGNHDPQAQLNWTFDPGRFTVTVAHQVNAGEQVFNNYGPKPNHELLQGYGFTIKDNPHDTVLMTLKAPSPGLQESLRSTHAGYFSTDGSWMPEKATFGLRLVTSEINDHWNVFEQLPTALLELLVLVVRDEHGLAFDVKPYSQVDLRDVRWQRYLPHITRILLASLTNKYARLSSSTPHTKAKNRKQVYAKQYRDGQLQILESYLTSFTAYLVSLEWRRSSSRQYLVRLVTLDDVLGSLEMHHAMHHAQFLAGISANAQCSDVEVLREAGWEDDMWVLLLCYIYLLNQSDNTRGEIGSWVSCLTTERQEASSPLEDDSARLEQAESLLEIVHTAAQAVPESIWANAIWTTDMIANTGARIFSNESFVLGKPAEERSSAPRMAVLWFNA